MNLSDSIRAQKTTTVMDPVLKTVYGTTQLGLTNNIYNKLFNDEDTDTIEYKTSCMVIRYSGKW